MYTLQVQELAKIKIGKEARQAVDELRGRGGEILAILRATPFFAKSHVHSPEQRRSMVTHTSLFLNQNIPLTRPLS